MNEKTDLRPVSAEQRATLTRIRSLLKRAETWPMHGDDNLRQWIDEMRYLVPLLLDRIEAAEAETARVRARLADLTEVFLLAVEYLPLKDRFEAHEHPGTITDFERIAAAAALARTEEP